jgi:hypothetical protein
MLFLSVAAPPVEETPVRVKTEIPDMQDITMAGPSCADTAFMDIYQQRGVTRSANWMGKLLMPWSVPQVFKFCTQF